MPTKKPSSTGRQSRTTMRSRPIAARRPATNVVYMHEHLTAKAHGSSLHCQRLRLMVDVALAAGAHADRGYLDRAMQIELRAAFPA